MIRKLLKNGLFTAFLQDYYNKIIELSIYAYFILHQSLYYQPDTAFKPFLICQIHIAHISGSNHI